MQNRGARYTFEKKNLPSVDPPLVDRGEESRTKGQRGVLVLGSCASCWAVRGRAEMMHRKLARRCRLHARSPATKLHSSAAARQQELLTRDFIAKSLYNQDTGYFSTKDVINDLPGPLEFGSMMGEPHYRLDVKKVHCLLCSCLHTESQTRKQRVFVASLVLGRIMLYSPDYTPYLLFAATQFDCTHTQTRK